jgi:putative methyltransferase (TIGR04325 family)
MSMPVNAPSHGLRIASYLRTARIRQVRFCSRWLRRIAAIRSVFAMVRVVRRLPVVREFLIALTGYNRPFGSLSDAAAAMSNYENGGQTSIDYMNATSAAAQEARLSDYPALFHIRPLLPNIRRVFDLGGGVGSLLYCYSSHIDIPANVTWIVCELPRTREIGERIARERSERRLVFTDRFADAEGVDLFIACGSLHYFERPLSHLIAELTEKPRHVVVNRTPLVDGPAVATVQDGDTYRLACMLYNRRDLIRSFEAIGFELVDEWRTTEYSVIIPCYPDLSASTYCGMFFRLKADDRAQ